MQWSYAWVCSMTSQILQWKCKNNVFLCRTGIFLSKVKRPTNKYEYLESFSRKTYSACAYPFYLNVLSALYSTYSKPFSTNRTTSFESVRNGFFHKQTKISFTHLFSHKWKCSFSLSVSQQAISENVALKRLTTIMIAKNWTACELISHQIFWRHGRRREQLWCHLGRLQGGFSVAKSYY